MWNAAKKEAPGTSELNFIVGVDEIRRLQRIFGMTGGGKSWCQNWLTTQ